MARGEKRHGQEHRPPIEPAKRASSEREPGGGRVRGPEERTPGEDVLGEDLRADDELLGEHRRSSDALLEAAIGGARELAGDRFAAEEHERMEAQGVRRGAGEDFQGRVASRRTGAGDLDDEEAAAGEDIGGAEGPPSHGLRSAAARTHGRGLGDLEVRGAAPDAGDADVVPAGREGAATLGQGRAAADDLLGPAEAPDAEALERAAAWEHTIDLERAGRELERDEGAAEPLEVTRPVDAARFDELANAAYYEQSPTDLLSGGERPGEPLGPGARMDRTERTAAIKAPGPAAEELDPPPESVREVQHGAAGRGAEDEDDDDAAARARATKRRTRRAAGTTGHEKAPAAAAWIEGEARAAAEAGPGPTKKKANRPRRASRRSEGGGAADAKKKKKKKKKITKKKARRS